MSELDTFIRTLQSARFSDATEHNLLALTSVLELSLEEVEDAAVAEITGSQRTLERFRAWMSRDGNSERLVKPNAKHPGPPPKKEDYQKPPKYTLSVKGGVAYPSKEAAEDARHLIRTLIGYHSDAAANVMRMLELNKLVLEWQTDESEELYNNDVKEHERAIAAFNGLPQSHMSIFIKEDSWYQKAVKDRMLIEWSIYSAKKYVEQAVPLGADPYSDKMNMRTFYQYMACDGDPRKERYALDVAKWAFKQHMVPMDKYDEKVVAYNRYNGNQRVDLEALRKAYSNGGENDRRT